MKKECILLITLLLIVSSSGCIDVYLIQDVLNKMTGEDETTYIWAEKLKEEGFFEMNLNGTTLSPEDIIRIINKMYTNITNGTITNIQKIVQEENIVLKKDKYDFYVIRDTNTLLLEITVDWSGYIMGTLGGGRFEITLKHEEKIILQESYNLGEKHFTKTIPITPNPGNWTIEIGGTGGSMYLSTFYQGEYQLLVKAYEPKE